MYYITACGIKQVEQVLAIEELLPNKLQRRFRCGYKIVRPNKKYSLSRGKKLLRKIQFIVWGGDKYDTHSAVKRALQTSQEVYIGRLSFMFHYCGWTVAITVDREIFAALNFYVLNFSAFNFPPYCKYSAK